MNTYNHALQLTPIIGGQRSIGIDPPFTTLTVCLTAVSLLTHGPYYFNISGPPIFRILTLIDSHFGSSMEQNHCRWACQRDTPT